MQSDALPWHSVSADDVINTLESRFPGGLSEMEADERLKKFGYNEPPRGDRFALARSIFNQLKSPLAFVLLITGVVTLVIGAWLDSIVIFIALSINVMIGVGQEGRASRIYDSLEKSHPQSATVERDGSKRVIPAYEIVPGDIVHLQGGNLVPADMRLIKEGGARLNEASITGEWAAVEKFSDILPNETLISDQCNMLWSGTTVAEGYAVGVAVNTGVHTYLGEIARAAQRVSDNETPLQEGVRSLARTIIIILSVIIAFTVVLGYLRGISAIDIILIAVAIGVAAMPEGLPAAVSVVLAVGMREIFKHGGLAKSLLAAETLGSTTVILTDKTGTLTEGEMSVSHLHTARGISEHISTPDFSDNRALLQMAILASDAFIEEGEDGKSAVHGRPIERAIIKAGDSAQLLQRELFANGYDRTAFLQFESARRYAASLNEDPGGGMKIYLSGSPEHLLQASTNVAVSSGARPILPEERGQFVAIQKESSSNGRALIAVAYRRVEGITIPDDVIKGPPFLHDLTFAGILVLSDTIRPDVKREIKLAQEAGVRVVMVTGDHVDTARAVAIETGIATDNSSVITGTEIAEMDQRSISDVVMRECVFARVTPDQKLRIVEALVDRGEVVAMTGDGVNDAPALNASDVGVALGSGTDVAKEASDIILLDNTFSTITSAIREGRRTVANLGKVVTYLLSTGVSEVLVIVGALVVGVPLPLLPTQLLWTNIIHEGFMSAPFAFEPAGRDVMKTRPRGLKEQVLTRELVRIIALVSVFGATLFLGFYYVLYSQQYELDHLRTLIFAGLSLTALSMALSFKDMRIPIWRIPIFSNPPLLYALAGSIGILVLTLSLPFMRSLLSLTILGMTDILLLVLFGIANLFVVEISKRLAR